jgi:hypothetical protein
MKGHAMLDMKQLSTGVTDRLWEVSDIVVL